MTFEGIKLRDFVENFVDKNAIISLVVNHINEDGYKCHFHLSSKYDTVPIDCGIGIARYPEAIKSEVLQRYLIPLRDGGVTDVGMAWILTEGRADKQKPEKFLSLYKDFYIDQIVSIYRNSNRDAINIVIQDTPNGGTAEILKIDRILNTKKETLRREAR